MLEVCAGPRALQNFLDVCLDTVPVRAIEALQDDAEVLGNLLESLEVPVAGYQADRDTNASEAASTPNPMQICLRVWFAIGV